MRGPPGTRTSSIRPWAGWRIALPAAYGPVDQMWPARARLAGTHDDSWLKQDFPGFARDIDWHFFNWRRRDQWLPENPDRRRDLRVQESASRAAAAARPPAGHGAAAVPGAQGTGRQLRGNAADADHGLVLPASRAAGAGASWHGRGWWRRMARTSRAWCSARPARRAAAGRGFPRGDGEAADTKDGADARLARRRTWCRQNGCAADRRTGCRTVAARSKSCARQETRRAGTGGIARENMRARGLDPDNSLRRSVAAGATRRPTLEELPAFAAAAEAEASGEAEKAEALRASEEGRIASQLAAAGMPDEEIQKRLDAKPKGPPPFSAAALRAEMAEQITAMRLLGQLTHGRWKRSLRLARVRSRSWSRPRRQCATPTA